MALSYQSRHYYFSHTSSPFYSSYFEDGGLTNYLPRLASNHDLSDLNLPCSYDYRCEPLVPSQIFYCLVAVLLLGFFSVFYNNPICIQLFVALSYNPITCIICTQLFVVLSYNSSIFMK
jgi:hypothetical protein